MPLAFESLSHGTIAFGFFNIESDMLSLDHYFFSSEAFHELINYVWRGGYPCWEDGIRPESVHFMLERCFFRGSIALADIEKSLNP